MTRKQNNFGAKIWRLREHNRKTEWISNIGKELEGLEKVPKVKMHINSPRTAPKKSTKQKKTKKKQQQKKKNAMPWWYTKILALKNHFHPWQTCYRIFFFFHCFGIYCFFFFFYISFIVSQYPFSLLSSFPRVVLFVFLVLLLPFSPNMFFFCFIIIACCRTFSYLHFQSNFPSRFWFSVRVH